MAKTKISRPDISIAKPKVDTKASGKIVIKRDTPVKMGRPSLYSDKLAEEFCRRIAMGRSLRSVCDDDDMPCSTTMVEWKNSNAEFASRYARAIEERGLMYGDRLVDMVDEILAGEYDVDRARLAIDTLKWTAARLAPKQYGDKQQVDVRVDLGKSAASVLMELSAKAQQDNIIDVTPNETTP